MLRPNRTAVFIIKLNITPELPSRLASEGPGVFCPGTPIAAALSPGVLEHDPFLETFWHSDFGQVPSSCLPSTGSPSLASSELERPPRSITRSSVLWFMGQALCFKFLAFLNSAFSVSKTPALAIESLAIQDSFLCCDLKNIYEFRNLISGSIYLSPPSLKQWTAQTLQVKGRKAVKKLWERGTLAILSEIHLLCHLVHISHFMFSLYLSCVNSLLPQLGCELWKGPCLLLCSPWGY